LSEKEADLPDSVQWCLHVWATSFISKLGKSKRSHFANRRQPNY